MEVSDYIKDQRSLRAKQVSVRMKWVIAGISVILATILLCFIFQIELFRFGSSALNSVGAKSSAKDLSHKAQITKMEQDSKSAYRSEVEWVELPRNDQSAFSSICLDYVPDGVAISFITTPHNKFKACVPAKHKDAILNKLQQTKMENKSQ